MRRDLDRLITEARNEASRGIDRMPVSRIIDLMLAEEEAVIRAIRSVRDPLGGLIECVVRAFRTGESLIYVGAARSGRLGVFDEDG